jgi:predicted metalloprotease with PDZ domain
VTRGRIGVQIDQVTKDVAESIGLGRPQGALVRSVESGSPADKAGIEAGDIITKFNGQAIERATDLPRMVGNTKPGSKAVVTVFRRGGSRTWGDGRRARAGEGRPRAKRPRPKTGRRLARGRSRWAWSWANSPTRRRRKPRSRAACASTA